MVDSKREAAAVASWPRPFFRGPGGTPFLFYVVYGQAQKPLRVSRSRHRCTGLAPELALTEYGPEQDGDTVKSFLQGYLWDRLENESPDLADYVSAQEHCTILRGTYPDGPTLDEFRNAIGLVTCLLESGCGAVFDPQMFKWWSAEEWKREVFEPAAALPRVHVTVLWSDEADGRRWLHTRGMRKFGRPDVSLRGVPMAQFDAALDLCNRFIELQAQGGVVQEGEEIRMVSLPAGMRCHHRGSVEDPDFNNVHLEIRWTG
ncbi:MAG: hypothetical protein ACREUE_12620 [Panacagrimonas sp.]